MRLTSTVRLTGTYASHRSLIGRLILIEGTPPAVGEVPSYLPDRLAHRRQAGVVGGINAGALEERLLRERWWRAMPSMARCPAKRRDGERGEGGEDVSSWWLFHPYICPAPSLPAVR